MVTLLDFSSYRFLYLRREELSSADGIQRLFSYQKGGDPADRPCEIIGLKNKKGHRSSMDDPWPSSFAEQKIKMPGADLLSHNLATAVSSALEVLTSGFGMGPGVSPPVRAPGNYNII